MRSRRSAGLLSLVLLGLGTAPLRAQSGDRIRVESIRDGVTVLAPNEGSGNTVIVEGTDGLFLVDTMADTIVTDFVAALDALDLGEVRYVVNTHWHQNHLGGNDRFTETATVFGTENLRFRLSEDQVLEYLVRETFPALPESYWPNELFEDSRTVEFGAETVRLWHRFGHTDTDIVVYFENARVAATGDLWTPRGTIAPDLDTGGSLYGVLAALDHLIDTVADDAIIVPGHGAPGTKADMIRYRDGLGALLEFVEGEKERGRTLPQVLEGAAPESVMMFTGPRPARLLEAAYRSEPLELLHP